MTNQELVKKTQDSLERTIKLFTALEGKSCEAAATCEKSAEANAGYTKALGLVIQAKGEATFACNVMPGITPQFGGK